MSIFSKKALRESRKGTPSISTFFTSDSPPRGPPTSGGALGAIHINSPNKTAAPSSSKSRKRGRADESDEFNFFDDTSMASKESEEGSVEAPPLTWQPTPFSTTDFVAKIPERPSEVAFRSTSVGGKGDSVIVLPEPRYEAAVALFKRRGDFPQTTNGVEDPPVPGVVRGGEDGVPKFMRTDRQTAVTAVMQAKEPYGSPAHKFLFLASIDETLSPAVQERIVAALPEVEEPEFSCLFVDENNEQVPLWGMKIVCDTGGGVDADYSGKLSDPRTRAVHDGRVIGGAQTGGSGQEGAWRNVRIGSAEEERVVTEAADTTEEKCTMVFSLWDVVAAVARSDTLFEQSLWLSGNVVGVAKRKGKKAALVKTKPGTTSNGEPWVYFTTTDDNRDHCGTGPVFLTVVADISFTGKKNLARRDKEAAGLEVGRSGDFSSPQSKGRANYSGAQKGRDKSTNELKSEGGSADYTAEQRGSDKGTRELKAEGGRTGGSADYTAEQRGSDKGTRELKAEGGAVPSGEQRNPSRKPRGPGGLGDQEFDYTGYRCSIGYHHRGYEKGGELNMSDGTSEFFEYRIGNVEKGAWVLGTQPFGSRGKRVSSYPYREDGTRFPTKAKVDRNNSYLMGKARDHAKAQG